MAVQPLQARTQGLLLVNETQGPGWNECKGIVVRQRQLLQALLVQLGSQSDTFRAQLARRQHCSRRVRSLNWNSGLQERDQEPPRPTHWLENGAAGFGRLGQVEGNCICWSKWLVQVIERGAEPSVGFHLRLSLSVTDAKVGSARR